MRVTALFSIRDLFTYSFISIGIMLTHSHCVVLIVLLFPAAECRVFTSEVFQKKPDTDHRKIISDCRSLPHKMMIT